MKPIILLVFTMLLFFLSKNSNAQCFAIAGNDTTFCISNNVGQYYLGGNPTAQNGVPPYVYTWECNLSFNIGGLTFYYTASDLLNDTTISNPYFISTIPSGIEATFTLNVVDSLGVSCNDSVIVSFCEFTMISNTPINLNKGDSINIYSFSSSSCVPMECLWLTDYNISNINDCFPLVWPDSTTTYHVLLTDSIGCQFVDIIEVVVMTANIENNINLYDIVVFPNPATDHIIIENENYDNSVVTIEIIDLTGKVLINETQNSSSQRICLQKLQSGVYFARISSPKNTSIQKFLIVK